MNRLVMLALLPALAIPGVPAFAAAPDSVTLQISDLDLSRPGDGAVLKTRVRAAAKDLCAAYSSAPAAVPSRETCFDTIEDMAREQLRARR